MSVFDEREIAYLDGQMLGRLATVGEDGQPHVVPVGFRYNPETETIDIGGHEVDKTKKFRDAASQPQVAFVVDDLASVNPWHARGIEIRGQATCFTCGGEQIRPGFGGAWIQIKPSRVISWGLDPDSNRPNARSFR